MIRRGAVQVLMMAMTLAGCSGLEGVTDDLRTRIGEIDLQETLSGLTDCDRLADRFVGIVKDTVATVDETGGDAASIPAGDLTDIVEEVSVSQYFDLAERVGCARVQAQLDLVDRLRDVEASTPSGESVLDQMIDTARSGG